MSDDNKIKSKNKHQDIYTKYLDQGKEDITVMKLVMYLLLFLIPLLLAIVASFFIATKLNVLLEASVLTTSQIVLIPFIFVVFFFLIPNIRQKENIKGVRLSLFGFLIFVFGISIFPMLAGLYDFILKLFIFAATYILLVFIFCPEVLGVSGNLKDWFRHGKQVIIVLIYFIIVLFYVFGFAHLYDQINRDATIEQGFSFPETIDRNDVHFLDWLYYSTITFATIGYGDITPVNNAAKLVATIEAFIGMVMNVLFIAILLVYVSNFQSFTTEREEKKIENVERKIEQEEREIEQEEARIKQEERRINSEEEQERQLLERIRQNQYKY
jgi:hypothetical protein